MISDRSNKKPGTNTSYFIIDWILIILCELELLIVFFMKVVLRRFAHSFFEFPSTSINMPARVIIKNY